MNRYKAISETEFIKFPSQELTEQEIHTLNKGTEEEILALKEDIKQRVAPVVLEGAELAEVETVYYAYKPQLEEGDDYKLISFDLTLQNGLEGKRFGAYNYKLNKQIFNVILK
jgi:hypothetical protein